MVMNRIVRIWVRVKVKGRMGTENSASHAGLLAILAKSIAIAIAILGGNGIAILSAILFLKSVLQYFLQYSISSLCTHTTWHWQSLSTVLSQVEATMHSHYRSCTNTLNSQC